MTSPSTLLTDPAAIVDAIVRDADACRAGDRLSASVYIVEPGVSSERVLSALRDAARRGARVRLAVDWTAGSHLSRLVERATTLLPRLEALARETPGLEVTRRRTPDHSKWFVFRRAALPSSAIVSSLNLGDRFGAWRDLGARVEGDDLVDALERALDGHGPDAPAVVADLVADLGAARAGTCFVVNAPPAGRWDVRPALGALLARPGLTRVQVAVAYLDPTGAALLERALARGASVDLVLPARANVYHHANLHALARLLAGPPGRPGRLRAHLVPGMLHAKALLAHGPAGPLVGWVGSANLKRNSFRLFAELAVLSTEPAFVVELARVMDALASESAPVAAPLPYRRLRAWIERQLG